MIDHQSARVSLARIVFGGFVMLFGMLIATQSQASCRLALALGLDVSASVDAREYRLQTEGLIYAFQTAEVQHALFRLPDTHVEVMIYEWSGPRDQYVTMDWLAVRSQADIDRIVASLRGARRATNAPGTAIGEAIDFGRRHLETRDCLQYTLDLSGDGRSNQGDGPIGPRGRLHAAGMTLNALVVGADASHAQILFQAEVNRLARYFQSHVITGNAAFVQTALGYKNYGAAMARKLEREISVIMLGAVSPDTLPNQ